jgi:hypothetical protein
MAARLDQAAIVGPSRTEPYRAVPSRDCAAVAGEYIKKRPGVDLGRFVFHTYVTRDFERGRVGSRRGRRPAPVSVRCPDRLAG